MEDMIAKIIASATVVITVGFCVWFGMRAARRNRQYLRKIEYLDDGFVYHGMISDTRVRWRDITSVEVKLETHTTYRGKYTRGKTSEYRVIDIAAGRKSFAVFPEDFENVNFDEFITTLERRVRGNNLQYQGIGGDVDKFREDMQALSQEPKVDAEAEAEENEFDRRFETRLAALGRPATTKERIAIVKELQREIKKERHKK